MPGQKITGSYSNKQYRCNHCGNIKIIGTNHWGDLYTRCPFCCAVVGMTCNEKMPDGYAKPEPYKLIKKEWYTEFVVGKEIIQQSI